MAKLGGMEGREEERESEREEHSEQKVGFDIRNVSIHLGSPSSVAVRRNRSNQELVGGERKGGGFWGLVIWRKDWSLEREREAEEREDSREREWEGRRWRSWLRRKAWAAESEEATAGIRGERVGLWRRRRGGAAVVEDGVLRLRPWRLGVAAMFEIGRAHV